MKPYMTVVTVFGIVLVLASGMACSQKRKPLVPLALEGGVQLQATQLTEQGRKPIRLVNSKQLSTILSKR